MQVAEYISEDFIILPGEPPQDVLHGVQPLFSVIDFCIHIKITIKCKNPPIKHSSLIINSFCATGKVIHVFHGSALTLPAFMFDKETTFNVLAKTLPAQWCLLTESIQQVRLQSTRHQRLRQLSEEAFEGSRHSVYGEVFLHQV